MINYNHNLLPDLKVWCTWISKKFPKVLKKQQKVFNLKQSALMNAGVSMTEADILSKEKKYKNMFKIAVVVVARDQ